MRRLERLVHRWASTTTHRVRRIPLAIRRRFQSEQLRPGHLYEDRLTGLYVTVTSVGPQVRIAHSDGEEVSLEKETVQTALDEDILVHRPARCRSCPAGGRSTGR